MRNRESADREFDQFERKLDQLATKADLARISIEIETMVADLMECFKHAVESHGAQLERIERTICEMNVELDVQNFGKEPPAGQARRAAPGGPGCHGKSQEGRARVQRFPEGTWNQTAAKPSA